MLCGWKFKRAYIEKRTQINALLCSRRDHEIFDSPRDVHVHFTYLHINNRITIQYLIILLVLRRFTPVLLSVHLSKRFFLTFFLKPSNASLLRSHHLIISLSHYLIISSSHHCNHHHNLLLIRRNFILILLANYLFFITNT